MNLKSKHILIIDDDPSHVNLVKKTLEVQGADVTYAHDIENGVKLVEQHQPHLIILDIKLENELGFKLLEVKHEWIERADTKIIIFSQVKDKAIISKALSYGIDDYMLKPLNSNLFIKKVKNVLKTKEPLVHQFSKSEKIDATFSAEISKFNEFEFIVTCPLKLAKDNNFSFEAIVLKSNSFNTVQLTPSGRANYYEKGLFQNKLNVIGANENFSKEIQKYKQVK